MRHPNLVQRQGTYYFRRRVPADLLSTWEGGPVVVRSLNTRDRKVAVDRLHAAQGELQKRFEDLRRDQAARSGRLSQAAQTGFFDLSDSEIAALVDDWRADRLRAIGAMPGLVLDVQKAKELLDEVDQGLARLTSPATEVLDQEVGTVVHRLLIRSGLPLKTGEGAVRLQAKDSGRSSTPVGHETVRKLFTAVREAEIHILETRKAHLRGVPSSAPIIQPEPRLRSHYSLDDLIRDFSNDPGRGTHSAKTDLDYGMIFRVMRDVIGPRKAVTEITREDCTRVRDQLMALPRDATKKYPGKLLTKIVRKEGEAGLRTRTINSHLSKMSSLLAFAVAEDRRLSSPALKLQIAETAEEQEEEGRRSFTLDELNAMFTAPLFVGCRDDGRNFAKVGPNRPRRSRFWVPLIALYSGLRQTEICQLTTSDIAIENGVPVIQVRKSDPSQKLKTQSARRYVPIHPELIRIGLLAYANNLRREGEVHLFPELRADVRGYKGAVFQKRFNSFRVSIGITDPNAVFHSFRHTWRDAMRNAGIHTEMAQVLGGWAGVGQDQRYGSERFSPDVRLRDISRITYEGLDLRHLYMF